MSFKITLAAARINAGYKQKDIAKRLGITSNTLISWERGESEPKVSQAFKLADLYNVPIDAINFLPQKSN